MHMCAHVGVRGNFQESLRPAMWVLGIALGLPGLGADASAYWAISLAQPTLISEFR